MLLITDLKWSICIFIITDKILIANVSVLKCFLFGHLQRVVSSLMVNVFHLQCGALFYKDF